MGNEIKRWKRNSCGIIRENSLKELESLMEIYKDRSIREKILMKAPEFGEIVKKKYE